MSNSIALITQIEGLLFVVGETGLTVAQLAEFTETNEEDVAQTLAQLKENYRQEERAFMLQEIAGMHRLITKPVLAPTIERLIENPPQQALTQASLEVLAIIAYKQPITRVEVEDLRGVKSERPIATLAARGLVQEVGRNDSTGRAILYGTTAAFLQCFGLQTLEELPPLPEDAVTIEEETELFMTQLQQTITDEVQ